jgi:hypothetical protein
MKLVMAALTMPGLTLGPIDAWAGDHRMGVSKAARSRRSHRQFTCLTRPHRDFPRKPRDQVHAFRYCVHGGGASVRDLVKDAATQQLRPRGQKGPTVVTLLPPLKYRLSSAEA